MLRRSVPRHICNGTEEESRVETQVPVQATGKTLTMLLKGYHPFVAQGGATLFDDVRVVDLGPQDRLALLYPVD